jgi:hypothetical protein
LIPELRKKFNSEFTEKKYQKFLSDLDSAFGYHIEFRIAETPIFLPSSFKKELINAGNEIVSFIKTKDYLEKSVKAIPDNLYVKNEDMHPHVLAVDFAVCKDESGNLIPQLIELQGFPSLYCYQELLNQKVRANFNIPDGYTNFFNGLNNESYTNKLKDIIIGDSNPENVILLEIDPENQKTRVDFSATEKWLDIKAVDICDVKKEGNKLFYINDNRTTTINRIYNRVIFDELFKRDDLKLNFHFTDDLDVKWIPHPNWFFRISKFTLPFIISKYVPRTNFLSELNEIPSDLENYILKPLFSFAGSGVVFDVTKEIIESIQDKENFILQKKIKYESVIETLDTPAKAEIRLLYLWDNEPLLVNNIVRLSKGDMMGVNFNKDKTWVGSSIAYFE